jgi:hypothetical protein
MMAFDRVRERVVVFGGEGATGRLGDTWEWDGAAWMQRTPLHAPERREEGVLVFDEAAGDSVLFAGWGRGHFTDTWRYGSSPPATAVPYGASCQGSAATAPALAAGRPWLGETVAFRADGLPSGAPAVVLFGVVRTAVPLNSIGLVGCVLHTDPLTSVAMATAGTSATAGLPLPATLALTGVQLFAQTALLAPGANLLGVLTTNGVELTAAAK